MSCDSHMTWMQANRHDLFNANLTFMLLLLLSTFSLHDSDVQFKG